MNLPLDNLPGADLVHSGLADIADNRETIASLLVQIGSPRLALLGIEVPVSAEAALDADRRLYRLLAGVHGNEAHSQFNSLIRRLVSFERALEQRVSQARRRADLPDADQSGR
jgi:hypothetical protein